MNALPQLHELLELLENSLIFRLHAVLTLVGVFYWLFAR